MIVLICIASFLFWGAFQKQAESYFKIGFCALFVATSLRYPALGGADNFQYYSTFEDVPPIFSLSSYQSQFKFGYILLNSIVKTFSDKYIFFQIGYSAICFILLYKIIKLIGIGGHERCLFLFGFLCYEFLWYFWGTLRQNVANLIFWILIIYYYKYSKEMNVYKKICILVLAIVLPYMFHSSAVFNIIFLPILLFMPSKVDIKRRRIFVVIFSILIYLTTFYARGIFVSLAVYFDDHYSLYENGFGEANIVNFIFKLMIFILYSLNYHKVKYIHKKFVLDVFTLYVLIGSLNDGVVGRVAMYYGLGIYVAMGFIMHYFWRERYVLFLYFIVMLTIFIRKALITDGGLNSHYYFFWQEATEIPTYFHEFWETQHFY